MDTTNLSAWDDIISYFPPRWRELAGQLKVMKGARQDKDLDATMRTLLMHLACGYSLKETAARARLAREPLYTSSHVALRDRLIKFRPLFKSLCEQMFCDGVGLADCHARLRLVDATEIHEEGPTGSLWRFHYSLTLPDLACDFTKLTETCGEGTGENLTQFPMHAGDHVLADRGYSRATGIAHAEMHGAKVCIRLNHGCLKLLDRHGRPFGLAARLRSLKDGGAAAEWDCAVRGPDGGGLIPGRVCAVRKTEEQAARSAERIRRKASKSRKKTSDLTLFVNKYVILFTTFEPDAYPLRKILAIYRWRWQIELLFKRFKSILQFGHVPTRDDDASRAWLYGKLFVALLAERISRAGNGSFSPWREKPDEEAVHEPMETLRLCGALAAEAVDP